MITKSNKRKVVDQADQIKKSKKVKLVGAESNSEKGSDFKITHDIPIKCMKKKSKKFKKKEIIEMADFEDDESGNESYHTECDSQDKNIDEGHSDEKICAYDPFIGHFNRNLPEDRASEIDEISNWTRLLVTWPQAGRMEVRVPAVDQTAPVWVKSLLDDDNDKPTPLPSIGVIPEPYTKSFDAISNGYVEEKLVKNINQKIFSAFQGEIFTLISNYIDFWHNEATHDRWEKIKRVYALHCLNHILKSKKQILKNNKQLKSVKEDACPPPLEDQGFTRPRVLILLPFKHSAYRLIKIIISLLGIEVMNRKKFETKFGPPEGSDTKHQDKPEDFQNTFAGDINEDFIIGITVTKNNIQLFSSFHKCDMIIASPLAMSFMLEQAKTNIEKNILSSIEVLVMDQADIFLMQNWNHVVFILDSMSSRPSDFSGMNFDIYRIHKWHFDNLAHHYKQTIIFSSTSADQIRDIMGKARNFAGKVTLINPPSGILPSIKTQAELIILRNNNNNPDQNEFDDRFAYFTKELLPMLRKEAKSHVLIYIPDHTDYLRLVNLFKSDGGTRIATVNEYMIEKEMHKAAKARSLFFDGKRPFMLYSERYHFYKRSKIKGARHIVFYSAPTYPQFFKEICEFLSEEYQNIREEFTGTSNIYFPYQASDMGKVVDIIGNEKMIEIEKSGKIYNSYITGVE